MTTTIEKFLFLVILIVTSITLSCNDDDRNTENLIYVNSIEELNDIIGDCRASEFQTKDEIENSMIGEWALIGIKSGNFNQLIKKDISLIITEEKIVLTDFETSEVSEIDWSIQLYTLTSNHFYYLDTNEPRINNRLGMRTFCSDFMFGDGRVDDGSIYVYQRVR